MVNIKFDNGEFISIEVLHEAGSDTRKELREMILTYS